MCILFGIGVFNKQILHRQEGASAEQNLQKAKVIETKDKEGRQEKKAVTEDGELIYLGYDKS